MRAMEQVGVQMHEIDRLIIAGDPARLRIALLLLDNVAELLLLWAAERQAGWRQIDGQYLRLLRELDHTLSADERRTKEELEQRYVTDDQWRKIDRYWDPKLSFLQQHGLISESDVTVLQLLHGYRNEAHHEGLIRHRTIETAVDLYKVVVCHLLDSLPIAGIADEMGRPPAGLVEYLEPGDEVQMAVASHFPKLIARKSMRARGPQSSTAIEALSHHLLSRLAAVRECVKEAQSTWLFLMSTDDILRLAQAGDKVPAGDFEALRAWQPEPGARRPLRLLEDVERWERESHDLLSSASLLQAFQRFGTIERQLEPLEDALEPVARRTDAEVEEAIDIRRGR